MYSKYAVAPRMRQPRQMTAAKLPRDAASFAAKGISNAPGTLTTQMSSPATPADLRASCAPDCSRSVTKSLNFDTTIANFIPGAFCDPSTVSIDSYSSYLPMSNSTPRSYGARTGNGADGVGHHVEHVERPPRDEQLMVLVGYAVQRRNH